VLQVLERERAVSPGPYWYGEAINHADIAVACALRFIGEAHPGTVDLTAFPALAAHAARCEALAVFQEISQPFIPPA
jgi:glutathione S-transferase